MFMRDIFGSGIFGRSVCFDIPPRGIYQNLISSQSSIKRSHSSRMTYQLSLFLISVLLLVIYPLPNQPLTHCVALSTTSFKSVVMTRLLNPSPGQYQNRSAAITARSSARLLVCGCLSPVGPCFSRQKNSHPACLRLKA